MEYTTEITGIDELLKQYAPESRFSVRFDQTLFGNNWKALKDTRCIWCGNRLKLTQKGLYICKSVKHKKSFVIKKELFDEVITNII